jgi:hypothetical protein
MPLLEDFGDHPPSDLVDAAMKLDAPDMAPLMCPACKGGRPDLCWRPGIICRNAHPLPQVPGHPRVYTLSDLRVRELAPPVDTPTTCPEHTPSPAQPSRRQARIQGSHSPTQNSLPAAEDSNLPPGECPPCRAGRIWDCMKVYETTADAAGLPSGPKKLRCGGAA